MRLAPLLFTILGITLACGGGSDGATDETDYDDQVEVFFRDQTCADGAYQLEAATNGDVVSVDLTLYDGPDLIDTWPLSARGSGWIVAIPPEEAGLDDCDAFDGLFGILTATGRNGDQGTAEEDLSPYGE